MSTKKPSERTARRSRRPARARRGSARGARNEGQPLFDGYAPLETAWDELFDRSGSPRPALASAVALLDDMGQDRFRTRQRLADGTFLKSGVTFRVYSDDRGVEKIFPFDLIPRTVGAGDWDRLERGLAQRIVALEAFLADVYGDQKILADGVIPREVVLGSSGYTKEIHGLVPPHGVRIHISGIDMIRRPDGELVVLEDNLRTPSGVSYVLENRKVMKRVMPRIFAEAHVRTVDHYPMKLRDALVSLSPLDASRTRLAILTPGPYNSAYFEHSFLARQMGCDLVTGRDLFVHDDRVFVKTTRGPRPVDVLYRRIDDEFLDPEVFNEDSLLGVAGLMRAWAAGNVVIANAVGNGVADDKALYPFVPAMVKYYLDEDAILPQVETFSCAEPDQCRHVLARLPKMVVKAVDASGGYGMLVGPTASEAEIAEFRQRVEANPRGYVAQPLVELSTCPTWDAQRGAVVPRRVDLRPYVVHGRSGTWALPGGLTRVALVEGSFVVNSSQGGGSKDTWVLEARPDSADPDADPTPTPPDGEEG